MRAVAHRVQAEKITLKNNHGLILHNVEPDKEAANVLFLRYAFVVMGPESHVFPAFILDDWGAEIRGLKLYGWFKRHANEFPRAEIFGFEQDGKKTQRFVREFEHYVKLPCYVYEEREVAVEQGEMITAVFLPTPSAAALQKLDTPPKEQTNILIRRARVSWWRFPAAWSTSQLKEAWKNFAIRDETDRDNTAV